MTKGKIFVTGGNGFIGSRVVRQLLEQGYEVRCLLRTTSNTTRIDGLEFEPVIGDVRDITSIEAGMTECHGVIHLASLSSWDDIHSPLMDEVVVQGSKNVLATASKLGNLRMVFVSSIIAVNGTTTPQILTEESTFTLKQGKDYGYAFAKRKVEALCREAAQNGLPVMIVNPSEVYGPDDTDMVTAGNLVDFATSPVVLVPSGGTSVAHVDDIATGIIAALKVGHPGERYILGGDNLTIKALADLTLSLLNQQKKIITIPNVLLSALAKIGSTLHIPLPFNPAVIPYAVKYWFVDNRKACQELGVQFRPAKEALAPTLQWLQEAGYVKGNHDQN